MLCFFDKTSETKVDFRFESIGNGALFLCPVSCDTEAGMQHEYIYSNIHKNQGGVSEEDDSV